MEVCRKLDNIKLENRTYTEVSPDHLFLPVSFKRNETTVNGATRQSHNLVGLPKPHSPFKLINMLSPTTAESALEWRAKCQKILQ